MAASFSRSKAVSTRRYFCRLLNKISPALMNSPRSTFGTTRMTAYSYKCLSCIFDSGYECGGVCQAIAKKANVRIADVVGRQILSGPIEPIVGDEPHDFLDRRIADSGAESFVGLVDGGGVGQEDVVLNQGEGALRMLFPAVPRVVEKEGGAVVDQPYLSVPDEQVGVSERAVYVGEVGVEPHDFRGRVGVDVVDRRVEGHGSRQVVQTEVQAPAGTQKVLNFLVAFRASERFVENRENGFRHLESEGFGECAPDQLGDQGFNAVPGAAEFQHVLKTVVGFGQSRQGTTFPQGRDVSDHLDGAGYVDRFHGSENTVFRRRQTQREFHSIDELGKTPIGLFHDRGRFRINQDVVQDARTSSFFPSLIFSINSANSRMNFTLSL